MTDKYIPASKLLALINEYDDSVHDLPQAIRALIDEAPEVAKQEPFCYLCDWGDRNGLQSVAVYYGEPGSATVDDWNETPKVHRNLPLYKAPHPDIVTELVKALEDDAHAATFQSMAQYRKWLLDLAKGVGK